MRLVELTGSPCAGKSYLMERLLAHNGMVQCDNSWVDQSIGISKLPSFSKTFLREIYLIFWGAICLVIGRNFVLLKTLMKTKWSLGRRLNVWRNILHKYAVHRLVSRQDISDMVLYDEGISHFPFLFATSSIPCPEILRKYYPYGRPKIIRVRASREDITERLKSRGHKMIKHDNQIEAFVRANEQAYILQTNDLASFPAGWTTEGHKSTEDIMIDLQKWISS